MSTRDTAATILEGAKAFAHDFAHDAVLVLERLHSEIVVIVPEYGSVTRLGSDPEYVYWERWNKSGHTVQRSRSEADALQLIADNLELQANDNDGRAYAVEGREPVSAATRQVLDRFEWS